MPSARDCLRDEPLLAAPHRRRHAPDRRRRREPSRADRACRSGGRGAPEPRPRRRRPRCRRPRGPPRAPRAVPGASPGRAAPGRASTRARPDRRAPSRARPSSPARTRSHSRPGGRTSTRAERPDLVARAPHPPPDALLLLRHAERRLGQRRGERRVVAVCKGIVSHGSPILQRRLRELPSGRCPTRPVGSRGRPARARRSAPGCRLRRRSRAVEHGHLLERRQRGRSVTPSNVQEPGLVSSDPGVLADRRAVGQLSRRQGRDQLACVPIQLRQDPVRSEKPPGVGAAGEHDRVGGQVARVRGAPRERHLSARAAPWRRSRSGSRRRASEPRRRAPLRQPRRRSGAPAIRREASGRGRTLRP